VTSMIPATKVVSALPDHTQLPESDGTFVKNFQEHPQSILLTESIRPVLEQRHPDGQYCIGQDSGIYWRLVDPPEKGAESPDWFYVPNVPPTLDGKLRRSYVLWKEYVAPLIAIEFVSGDGREERDRTPPSQREQNKVGKFWVYEKAVRIPYYAIYEAEKAQVEVYHLQDDTYELMAVNERGHFPIPPLEVELGIWQGRYQNAELPWLRWWDRSGNLLPNGEEQAQQARQQAQQARQQAQQAQQQAQQAQQQAERLASFIRSQGFDPDNLPES
jgi:Uma2 family endonuclease